MYCDFIDLSSQEGDVSCAINHVVCTITKAGGVHTALPDKQVNCVHHKGWGGGCHTALMDKQVKSVPSQRLGGVYTALLDKQVKSGV